MTLAVKRLPSVLALRAVEAAVRRRSYTAAARELSITQGAVSQQIRKVEAELGARLFERQGNEMIPTPEAVRLAEQVRAALERLQSAFGEAAAAAAQDPLVLSVDPRFASRWLGPKLPRLLADPAGANLDIRVEDRVANFASDGVDMGIRAGRGDWPDLETRRLTTEKFCVVCSPEFAARHRIASPEDLLSVPLIHSTDRLWPILFDRYGLPSPPSGALVSNNTVLVVDAVSRGLGAALARYSMVEEDLRAGRLVRPVPDILPLPVNFIRPGQLVRLVRDGDPEPAPIGYFAAWRADNRKRRRIQALSAWLAAQATASEAWLAASAEA